MIIEMSSTDSARQGKILHFSSDFIVGFPIETEEDFAATLALVMQIGYAGAYSFKYSPRPGNAGGGHAGDGVSGRDGRAIGAASRN